MEVTVSEPCDVIRVHKVVFRYHDTQLKLGKKYLETFVNNSLNTHFIPNNSDLIG